MHQGRQKLKNALNIEARIGSLQLPQHIDLNYLERRKDSPISDFNFLNAC